MYLSATFDLPNGATAYVGRVSSIETSADGTTTTIVINYYVDLTQSLILWQARYAVPEGVVSSGTYPDNIFDWLVSGSGPLVGATIQNDVAASIEDAKLSKWVEIKAYRDADEFGGCETPLGRIQSDEISQTRVTSTLTFANLDPSSFGIGWTMADNTVVYHDYAAFQNMAYVLGQHVSNAHTRAQALREKLYLLDNIIDVEAFDVSYEWTQAAILDEDGFILTTEASIDLVA